VIQKGLQGLCYMCSRKGVAGAERACYICIYHILYLKGLSMLAIRALAMCLALVCGLTLQYGFIMFCALSLWLWSCAPMYFYYHPLF